MKYSNTAKYYCGTYSLEVTIRDNMLKIKDYIYVKNEPNIIGGAITTFE